LLWAFYQLSGETLPAQVHDANGKIIADRVFPFFLTTKIPAGLAGIFMAALFSAAHVHDVLRLELPVRRRRGRLLPQAAPELDRPPAAVRGQNHRGRLRRLAVGIGAFIACKGESALSLYYAATAIVSAGLAGMFLLAFFSRRANRQGLVDRNQRVALLFTAWATLTGGKYKMLDLGAWNYTWPDVMIGVVAHLIVLVVGYGASWMFPADANLKTEWTIWGWLAQTKNLGAKK
jgi:SSS family solute:Na+ symporter